MSGLMNKPHTCSQERLIANTYTTAHTQNINGGFGSTFLYSYTL